MRITCDSDCCMGYIYLQPPRSQDSEKNMTTISKYVRPENLVIPVRDGNEVNMKLANIEVSPSTYSQAIAAGEFEEEFHNDEDEEGYLYGVEVALTKEEFIRLVEGKHCRIYNSIFGSKNYHLVTLDTLDKVFGHNNIMYPLTDKRDVFVIVEINDYHVGLIKGLLSSRQDIYDLDYLSKPEFILYE